LVSLTDACLSFGVSPTAARNWIARGYLPNLKSDGTGKHRRLNRKDIERLVVLSHLATDYNLPAAARYAGQIVESASSATGMTIVAAGSGYVGVNVQAIMAERIKQRSAAH